MKKALILFSGTRSFEKVFTNKKALETLNSIVHPAVREDFKEWVKIQNSPYVIQENPLIFENKNESHFDFVISVVADEEIRIKKRKALKCLVSQGNRDWFSILKVTLLHES